jgi:TonB-dependent receptor
MNRFLLVSASTVVMLAGTSGAFAQAAAPATSAKGELEEVIVTGVRASVESALETKRDATQIVDAISAEDIGKLPDNSVSEALQRVTGIQIARARGDANLVLIRGLPDIVTTINNRQIFTAANRSVSLADIPADLVKQVQVFKTQEADQFTGGLVGAINVDLRRPFDFQGLEVAGSVRGIYSDETDKTDPIVSGLVSDRWQTDAGEFGAMVSVSYQDKNYLEANTFNGTYDLVTLPAINPTAGHLTDQVYRPFVIGSIYTVGETKRKSANVSFQWAPNDRTKLYLDGFYVKYNEDYALNFWIPLPGIQEDSYTLKAGAPAGVNVAQTWNSTDIFTLTSNQAFTRASETYQAALGGEWEITDQLTFDADLAYTNSEASNRDAILDTAFIAPKMQVDFSQRGASNARITNADGSPFDVTDSSHYFLNQLFDQHDDQHGDDTNFTANLKYKLDQGFFTALAGGIQVGKRTAENNAANGAGIPIPGGPPVFVDDVQARTGFSGIQAVTPNTILHGDRNLATTQWFIADREFLLDHTPALRGIFGVNTATPPNDPTKFFSDEEDTYAAYVQTGFAFDMGVPVDGVIGVRYAKTDSSLQGTASNTDNATGVTTNTPVSIDKSDTDTLPSLNIRFKLTDDLHLRLAASQTVNRPRFVDLNPQTSLRRTSGNTLPGQGEGGNPNLDNPKATNVDLSLEWYFRPGSALAAAVFNRDIDGYIQLFNSPETYLENTPTGPQQFTYQVTRPQNTDAKLKGAEVAYTQFFDMLPGWLSGFGTQLNYTYVDATADIPDLTQSPVTFHTGPVTNVSKNAYNVILIYEKYGLSSRLAYNWRDDYIESYNQSGAQPPAVVVKDAAQMDFSLGYNINEKVTIAFDATNLLDRPVLNYFGTRSSQDQYLFPRDVRSNDRTFSLGVRWRL